jgi:hypothetical protein
MLQRGAHLKRVPRHVGRASQLGFGLCGFLSTRYVTFDLSSRLTRLAEFAARGN